MVERCPDENGWLSSARSWINRMSGQGDFAREYVLDHLMLKRALDAGPTTMLDIGCGEGRFCRMMSEHGVRVTGIDPVETFVNHARDRNPDGVYEVGFAEELPFADESFDLVVFYLSLIDINDIQAAIDEAVRILKPNGTLLIANLSSFFTSNGTIGWVTGDDGKQYHPLGTYLEEKADWFEWDELRIRNWHRPLSSYMTILIDAGLKLTYFDEPKPIGGPKDRNERYLEAPFLMLMEWKKPSESSRSL